MPDHFYVYPAYLSRRLSRREGRKVPGSRTVPEATIESLLESAKRVGLKATAEPEKRYPREPLLLPGRLRIEKKGGVTKARALLQLADDLRAHAVPGSRT